MPCSLKYIFNAFEMQLWRGLKCNFRKKNKVNIFFFYDKKMMQKYIIKKPNNSLNKYSFFKALVKTS